MIHEAIIDDAGLERLVCEHRDNAGRAGRLFNNQPDRDRFAGVQNGWADIYQELLDWRRHDPVRSTQRDGKTPTQQ